MLRHVTVNGRMNTNCEVEIQMARLKNKPILPELLKKYLSLRDEKDDESRHDMSVKKLCRKDIENNLI